MDLNSDTLFFDRNLRLGLKYFHKEISLSDLSKIKFSKKLGIELYSYNVQHVLNIINDPEDLLRMTELVCIFCLNECSIIIMFYQGFKSYHFNCLAELQNFIAMCQINWVLGDQNIFIHPSAIDYINNTEETYLEVSFKNGLFLHFETLFLTKQFQYLCYLPWHGCTIISSSPPELLQYKCTPLRLF